MVFLRRFVFTKLFLKFFQLFIIKFNQKFPLFFIFFSLRKIFI